MQNVKVTTGQSHPKPWPVSEIFVPDISNPVFCVREKSVITQEKKFRDGLFIVTQEKSCPLYDVGEVLKIENSSITVPSFKPVCMFLAEKISKISISQDSFSRFPKFDGIQKSKFDCGGCSGLIRFEYKKDKDFATLQMKMLAGTTERRRRRHLDKFFGVLRQLDVFESLDDDALIGLTSLLELKTIPVDNVVLKKGEVGTHLFIILSGKVAVIAADGLHLAEIESGEIFGEMSLLSEEPVTNSFHTIEGTQVAMLSNNNFKHILKNYPILHLFLLKMLVNHAQTTTLRSGDITSGMTGDLTEINTVDLLQLINSSQMTGTIDFALNTGMATVSFKEGEIIQVRYLEFTDKDAFFELLAIKKGRFSYTKGISPDLENVPPIGGFMGMIMEGLQRIDEES